MKTIRKFALRWQRLAPGIVLAGLLLFTAAPAFSQGCALCYTQAASSGKRMIQALKSGILILIIPPTLGSIGLVFVVHRKRNQVRQADSGEEPGGDWDQADTNRKESW